MFKKKDIAWMSFAVILFWGALVYYMSQYLPEPLHDNIVEEAIEHRIKEETGFDIDLTPSSKENEPRCKPNLEDSEISTAQRIYSEGFGS